MMLREVCVIGAWCMMGNGDVNECGRATSNVNAFTCYYTLLRMISNTPSYCSVQILNFS